MGVMVGSGVVFVLFGGLFLVSIFVLVGDVRVVNGVVI